MRFALWQDTCHRPWSSSAQIRLLCSPCTLYRSSAPEVGVQSGKRHQMVETFRSGYKVPASSSSGWHTPSNSTVHHLNSWGVELTDGSVYHSADISALWQGRSGLRWGAKRSGNYHRSVMLLHPGIRQSSPRGCPMETQG